MMRKVPEGVDIAVIGAGPAGCSAALPAARAGLSVLLVERERASDVGRKVCGNALGIDGLAPVARQVALPEGAEVAAHLESGTFYMPDGKTGVRMPAPGVVLNRLVYGQRLLADAVAAGAHLLDGCSCVGWSDREATRVRLRFRDGHETDVSAGVVIDASGFRSVLTHDGGTTHDDPIARTEVGVGYREIVSLPVPFDERTGGFLVFAAPGAEQGYAWVFPMGGRLANVGIGTTLASVKGSLREAYDAFVAGRPELVGAECVASGAGMVPLRRALASLVGDGFMTVGDAGCQTNPLHGGGIVPSVRAGVMAGEQAVAALADGSTSAEALWGYGARFMREIGGLYAAHDALRRLIYSLSDGDLAFLSAQLARSGRFVDTLERGSLLPGTAEALKRIAALARRPGLAARIIRTSRAMVAARRHYQDYPDSPSRLASWIGRREFLRRSR
ncbi:MAG: NAD(P)/FAD-dependent oxidoreductase, partial [Candidatus Eisenbacteria sp.]|nr:NAD(P)/FAD-dependent oxidoreductase [Candidatus Eisenbacteria bacterium]